MCPDMVCMSYPVIHFTSEAHEDSFRSQSGGGDVCEILDTRNAEIYKRMNRRAHNMYRLTNEQKARVKELLSQMTLGEKSAR